MNVEAKSKKKLFFSGDDEIYPLVPNFYDFLTGKVSDVSVSCCEIDKILCFSFSRLMWLLK